MRQGLQKERVGPSRCVLGDYYSRERKYQGCEEWTVPFKDMALRLNVPTEELARAEGRR